jgi:hypothetical protein
MTDTPVNTSVDNDKERQSYPVKTFKVIEPFVGNVYKKYGNTEIISNQKVADANNLAANSIKQMLSTSQQYTSLRNFHGKGYQVTEEFTHIYHPENEDEKLQLIVKCLKDVPFYRPLFNDYEDKAVPSIEGLQNRFIREYKMKEHIAKNAAEIFIQNLKDFNLLNARNILILPTSNNSAAAANSVNNGNGNHNSNPKNTDNNNEDSEENNENNIKIPIRLKGGRMAYLSFPAKFEDDDIKKMFKILKAYLSAYADIDFDENSKNKDEK